MDSCDSKSEKTEEGIILTDAYKKQIMESAEWKKIFLHTENYPDILLEDLKRNPEMLEFVEGYNDVHKKSSEGLTFEERKKKVPYLFNGIKDGDMNLMEQVI